MRKIRIFLLSSVLLITSCGLDKMARDYNKVNFVESPPVLETHGGDISVDFTANFPEEYFVKKANLQITPVLITSDGKESVLKSMTIQGEEVSGGDATVFYESGGEITYSDNIPYNDNMKSSTLELRATASLDDDVKEFDPVKIAEGVITTSLRVKDDEKFSIAPHGYEDTIIVSESATIYFLVNKSNIRTSEKSAEDVKRLKEFIKKGYTTASFEIRSYASPEGSVSINDELSNDRNENTLKYAKYLMKKLRADGSSDDENYTTISVGEDWDGFYNLVNESDMSDKGIINRIVKSNRTPEEKEQAIRDMAEVYDAIDKDILPYLRKAEITINAYYPRKTKEEILDLAVNNPDSLSIDELLYAAHIHEDDNIAMNIYSSAVSIYDDWRASNNLEVLKSGDKFESLLNENYDCYALFVNAGIVSAWNGNFTRAQDLYEIGNASNHNKGILSIRMGDYRAAARYFRGQNSYNASLVSLLNGNYNNPCKEMTPECFYLNAIIGSRSGNDDMMFSNLEKAVKDPNFKAEAALDLEFSQYRQDSRFIDLIK